MNKSVLSFCSLRDTSAARVLHFSCRHGREGYMSVAPLGAQSMALLYVPGSTGHVYILSAVRSV